MLAMTDKAESPHTLIIGSTAGAMGDAQATAQCEHCGDDGPLMPTPEGDHCAICYELVMGDAIEDAHSRRCGSDAD
jgi:hypothetical protein